MAVLRQLLYASSAAGPPAADSLAQILAASHRNNAATGITGALLYADGNFLQVLEGDAEAVSKTFARVSRDPRHRGVIKMIDRTVAARSYPDWAMGLVKPETLGDAEAVRSVWDATVTDDPLVQHMVDAFLAGTRAPERQTA